MDDRTTSIQLSNQHTLSITQGSLCRRPKNGEAVALLVVAVGVIGVLAVVGVIDVAAVAGPVVEVMRVQILGKHTERTISIS